MNDRQLEQARRLVERLATNAFYAPRLAAAGIRDGRLRSLDQWRDIPLTDKSEMLADQETHPPYGSRLGVSPGDIRQTHLTSGTSGFGQEVFALSAADEHASGRTWTPTFDVLGLRPGELFVTFYPINFLAYGRSLMEAGRVTGVQVMSLAGVDRSLALALMRRLHPQVIGTRPALLYLLADELTSEGIGLRDAFPALRGIVASGVAPISRVTEIQESWGTTVHEVYGSSQAAGIIAATGPAGAAPGGNAGVLEIVDDLFIVEFLDPDTLEAVEEGSAEVVLTCLGRDASPLVRFRTRDRVDVVPPGDGRASAGIRVGSIGRFDDMCKVRGNNVWPEQLDESVLSHPLVRDYRCEIALDARSVDVMRIFVLSERGPLNAPELDDLRRRVKVATNVTPTIDLVDSLPDPGPKPRRLVDLRQEAT